LDDDISADLEDEVKFWIYIIT